MVSALDLLSDAYQRRARRWHWASLAMCWLGVGACVATGKAWPVFAGMALSMAMHRQWQKLMAVAEDLLNQRIAHLRAELRAMGIDPDA